MEMPLEMTEEENRYMLDVLEGQRIYALERVRRLQEGREPGMNRKARRQANKVNRKALQSAAKN